MFLKEAYQKGIELLKSVNNEAPAAEAGVILCLLLQKDRSFLYTHLEYVLSEAEEHKFFEFIHERAKGVPLQHLTGYQEFMSLNFRVNRHVLIPRQDTEILVETVIDHAKAQHGQELRILDIGTGSGCIAVSLAYYIKNSRLTAVDISAESLRIACANAADNGVGDRVTFIQSNLFEGLAGQEEGFDIIVSNPPYIPTGDIPVLQLEVREYDPLHALDGGQDGLDFYRAITENSVNYLKPGGFLGFEVGYDQAACVAALMQHSFSGIRIIKDLSGVDRVVTGCLKPLRNE